MIVGRKPEIKLLEDLLKRKTSRFLAIYGRRRVGKTFLVREFFKGRGTFFELVGQKNASRAEQLANFATSYGTAYLDGAAIPAATSWREALALLTDQLQKRSTTAKQILFFDELPWLGSDLLRALDHAWNAHWSKLQNVVLIVCGSAASWMIRRVVNSKGGLYNRLTDLIHLQPFDLVESRTFLRSHGIRYPLFDLVELYLATGGIPHYLDLLKPRLSVAQNIEQLVFGDRALLRDEYDRLFEALFDNSANHQSLMRRLAGTRTGRSRTALKADTELADGTLHNVLSELEASGFIKRYAPFGHKKRGSFYRLADEFSLFYLRWVEPLRHKKTSDNYWAGVQQGTAWSSWAGYSFEWFCEKHHRYLLQALGISGILSTISKWRFAGDEAQGLAGAEIDLVIDRADSVINACELKFTRKPWAASKSYTHAHQQRLAIFEAVTRTRKSVVPLLVSASGALDNVHLAENFQQVVTLEDLFPTEQ